MRTDESEKLSSTLDPNMRKRSCFGRKRGALREKEMQSVEIRSFDLQYVSLKNTVRVGFNP